MSQSIRKTTSWTALALAACTLSCASQDKRADHPGYGESVYEPEPTNDESALTPASRQMSAEEAAANARGPEPAPEPAPASPPPEPLDDARIAAITDAANGAEVEQARIASTKLVKKLELTPLESTTSTTLKNDAATTLATLKDETIDFDLVYIKAQVDGHRKVLELFDQQLIPAARDPQLSKMLQEFRPKVEAHLTEAIEIQKVLDAEAGANRAGANERSPVPEKQTPGTTPDLGTRGGAPPPPMP
jgi:hypothetical protein